jgi:HSP20 family protein
LTDTEIVLLMEVAGVRAQDFEIEIDDREITIAGERCPLPGKPHRKYSQMEIPTGPFKRIVTLPATINPEQAAAVYKDGVLEVVAPRAPRVVGAHLRIVVHQ